MLLQVLYSVRSERQLVEQIEYNLLFRWFVGRAIEDTVWNHSVFSKNRDRLIEFEAVTELFNATVEMADKRGLLSGEHFSVDGTLIQAWASHKTMRRKDGSDDGRLPEDWRGEPRSNDTHESTSDPESRLYRKSNAAPALPSYLGHVLTDNRHGLVVNVQASTSDGMAERDVAAQMLADVVVTGKRVTAPTRRTTPRASSRPAERSTSPRTSHRTSTAGVAAPSMAARPGTPATQSASEKGSASNSASAGASSSVRSAR